MPEIPKPLSGQERFVAPLDQTPLEETGTLDTSRPPEGRWRETWRHLRKNPLFWISSVILALLLVLALVPEWFTTYTPRESSLGQRNQSPSSEHFFGTSNQGYDVYTRVVYGARASVLVGVLATLLSTAVGLVMGAVAGFYGGIFDEIISRMADVFFAIPLLLGAIVALSAIKNQLSARDIGMGFWTGILSVVLVLAVFGWPQVARIARSAVLQVKTMEFVDASRAIGSSRRRDLWRHVVPNSLAPVIVVTTVSLGIFIVAEATLSYLGVGLPTHVISWGNDINAATTDIRYGRAMHTMFFPGGALFITVLGFMLLGDALRDALDPKARKS